MSDSGTTVTDLTALSADDRVRINGATEYRVEETGSFRGICQGDYVVKLADAGNDCYLVEDEYPEGVDIVKTDGRSGWGSTVTVERL